MRTALIALAALLTPALAAPPLAQLGTFELDPVALLRDGEEIPGSDDLATEFRHFEYRFSSKEHLEAFLAEPDRFAVRQGGACPRMGALSGVGRTDLWAVHNGGLYFAASEGCRATFVQDPERLLERDDPALDATPESIEAGNRLVSLCVEWMGGREALLGLGAYRVVEAGPVESGDHTYDFERVETITLDGSMHRFVRYDDRAWTQASTTQDGYFSDGEAVRLMDPEQLGESNRRSALRLPVLLAAWANNGVEVSHLGADGTLGGERVALRMHGKAVELVIDPETGRLLAQRHRGWAGSQQFMGQIERRFTAFHEVDGVRFPVSWDRSDNGEMRGSVDRTGDRHRIESADGIEASLFEVPSE